MLKKTVTLLLIAACLSFAGCKKTVEWNGDTMVMASLYMAEDFSNYYRSVGMADNVFVGTVTEVISNVLPLNSKKHEDNFSSYKIHVDKNIKGELVEEVEARKMGGFKKDGTMLVVEAEMPTGVTIVDAGQPKVGRQYIFLAYAQKDGSLILSELLDDRECSDALIEEYMEYCANEIIFDRERFVSKYAK